MKALPSSLRSCRRAASPKGDVPRDGDEGTDDEGAAEAASKDRFEARRVM
jgi:hypothetical protein